MLYWLLRPRGQRSNLREGSYRKSTPLISIDERCGTAGVVQGQHWFPLVTPLVALRIDLWTTYMALWSLLNTTGLYLVGSPFESLTWTLRSYYTTLVVSDKASCVYSSSWYVLQTALYGRWQECLHFLEGLTGVLGDCDRLRPSPI